MIVLDASAWVVALLDAGPRGDAVRQVLVDDPDWLAPTHMVLEVLRTLRRYELAGSLPAHAVDELAAAVRGTQVSHHPPDDEVLGFAWRYRHNLSPYDAPYVALALIHDAPLVTSDERLARAAHALGAVVVVPEVPRS